MIENRHCLRPVLAASGLVPARTLLGLILLAACVLCSSTALAQTDSLTGRPLFDEPSLAPLNLDAPRPVPLTALFTVINGKLYLTYNGGLPGKTIEMFPGRQRQISVTNLLSPLTVEQLANFQPPVLQNGEPTEVKDFLSTQSSVTNLHTHGLHVSPQGRSDNVLLKINRTRSNIFTYDLPPFHAPGTHWYHAHLHGSTALQVQGGMAGALIVRAPQGQSLNPVGFDVEEKILVLQIGNGAIPLRESLPAEIEPALQNLLQEQAAAENSDPQLKAARQLTELLSPANLSGLAAGVGAERQQELAAALQELQRPTFRVNGLVNPALAVQPGDILRLRIVNAGSRLVDNKSLWIENIENEVSTDQGENMYLAAFDGINLTQLSRDSRGQYLSYNKVNPLLLAPGNRADVYFIPPSRGTYVLKMQGAPPGCVAPNLTGTFTQELLTLRASNPDFSAGPGLTAAEYQNQVNQFLDALDRNLRRLQGTAPYQGYLLPINNSPEVKRRMVFDISPRPPCPPGQARTFTINGRDYNEVENGQMRGLSDYLGKAGNGDDGGRGPNGQTPWPPRTRTEEEWTVVNPSGVPHPFHIHVNPFWVYDITEMRSGRLVSLRQENPNDPRLNRWQDTINLPPNGGSVTIRHRFSEFDGLFVLHCHILQHEDRGMMLNVLIVPNNLSNPQAYFDWQSCENDRINREINGLPSRQCPPPPK